MQQWLVFRITQPDGTLFFLIFTYLWGISHGSFRNYGSNAAIYNFFEPEINRGEFRLYFELFEKSCRGRHHSEISKTNAKTLIFPIWIHPQGSQGCQVCQDPLNMPFEVWCANIAPKLNNIWKSLWKQHCVGQGTKRGRRKFWEWHISMICLCSKYFKNWNIFGQILNIWVKLILKKKFEIFFSMFRFA